MACFDITKARADHIDARIVLTKNFHFQHLSSETRTITARGKSHVVRRHEARFECLGAGITGPIQALRHGTVNRRDTPTRSNCDFESVPVFSRTVAPFFVTFGMPLTRIFLILSESDRSLSNMLRNLNRNFTRTVALVAVAFDD